MGAPAALDVDERPEQVVAGDGACRLGTESFPANAAGYRRLLGRLERYRELDSVGVEGTDTWGAGLARHLADEDVRVVEVGRPNRQHRRRHGNSDTADAIGAARTVTSVTFLLRWQPAERFEDVVSDSKIAGHRFRAIAWRLLNALRRQEGDIQPLARRWDAHGELCKQHVLDYYAFTDTGLGGHQLHADLSGLVCDGAVAIEVGVEFVDL